MVLRVLSAAFFALASTAFVSAAGPLGSWSVVGDTGVVCIHSVMLPGPEPAGTRWKILCMERPHAGQLRPYPTNPKTAGETTTEVDIFNTANPFTTTHVSRNPFCSGHAQMADGRIFIAGGDRSTIQIAGNTEFLIDGRTSRRIYVPLDQIPSTQAVKQPWLLQADMTVQRWYPTIITLPDTRQLIVSGSIDNLDLNNMTLATKNPTYEYFPSNNEPRLTLDILDRAHPWNLYPLVFLLPKTGNVFIFAGNESAILNTKTNTADETSIPRLEDPRTYVKIYPYTPTGVLLPLTKKNNFTATVRHCGGTLMTNESSPYCFKISPEETGAKWVEDDALPGGKVMPDVVILPDGKILYVNGAVWGVAGGDGGESWNAHPPSFDTYLYDPEGETGKRYTNLSRASVGRMYHSGALLTPDGRVVTVGSEMANWADVEANRTQCYPFARSLDPVTACIDPFETRVEAFEPPYFNVANRISVDLTRAPRNLTHGSYFQVYLNKGFESRYVTKANFVRYGSTTHSTNADQRLVEAEILSQNPSSGRLVIEVPPNANAAPPGNYMLWLLDENGVPASNSVTILVSVGTPDKSTQADAKWVPTPSGNTPLNTFAASPGSKSYGVKNGFLQLLIILVFISLF